MTKSKPRLSCDHLKFIKSKLRLSCDHLEGFRMTKSKPRLSCDQAATELRPLVGAATELRPFDNMKISESKPRPSCDHLRFTESKPRPSCDRFALELRPFGRRDVAATSQRPFFFTWEVLYLNQPCHLVILTSAGDLLFGMPIHHLYQKIAIINHQILR